MTDVLFFGRKDCAGTQAALRCLQDAGCKVMFVQSAGKGERLPDVARMWTGDYIFCYRSFYILDAALIAQARIAAINFHPAPPEYPGSGCINFALYDDVAAFGVTAHLMNAQVDSGQILRVDRFPVLPQDNIASLLDRTHQALTTLFLEVVADLLAKGPDHIVALRAASQGEAWRGKARRMKELDALQIVTPDMSEEELTRRIRAMHLPAFPLYLTLHGRRFVLDEGGRS